MIAFFGFSLTAFVSAISKRNSSPEASSSSQSISSSVSRDTSSKLITDNTTCDKNTSHSVGEPGKEIKTSEYQIASKSTGKKEIMQI